MDLVCRPVPVGSREFLDQASGCVVAVSAKPSDFDFPRESGLIGLPDPQKQQRNWVMEREAPVIDASDFR